MRFIVSFALSLLINVLIIFLFAKNTGVMPINNIPPPPEPITLTFNFVNEIPKTNKEVNTTVEKVEDKDLVKLESFQPQKKASRSISIDLPQPVLPEEIIKKAVKMNTVKNGITILGPISKVPQKEISGENLQPYSLDKDIGVIPARPMNKVGGNEKKPSTIRGTTSTEVELLKPYKVGSRERELSLQPKRFSYIQRNFEISNAKEIFASLQNDYRRTLKNTPLSLQPLLIGDVIGELIIHKNGTVTVKVKSSPSSKLSDIFIRNLSKLFFSNRRSETRIEVIVSFKIGSEIE